MNLCAASITWKLMMIRLGVDEMSRSRRLITCWSYESNPRYSNQCALSENLRAMRSFFQGKKRGGLARLSAHFTV